MEPSSMVAWPLLVLEIQAQILAGQLLSILSQYLCEANNTSLWSSGTDQIKSDREYNVGINTKILMDKHC